MPARLLSQPSRAVVGDTLRVWLLVFDTDATAAAADTVTISVRLPDDSTAAGTATAQTSLGLYEITYDLASTGEHSINVTVTSADFGDDVFIWLLHVHATTGSPPDMSAVKAYLTDTSATDEEISDALAAEQAAQSRRCTIPADYPEDLAQALKRRVARNLAARAVPIAAYTSFEGGTTAARVPKTDAEIERLEAPYRAWPIA